MQKLIAALTFLFLGLVCAQTSLPSAFRAVDITHPITGKVTSLVSVYSEYGVNSFAYLNFRCSEDRDELEVLISFSTITYDRERYGSSLVRVAYRFDEPTSFGVTGEQYAFLTKGGNVYFSDVDVSPFVLNALRSERLSIGHYTPDEEHLLHTVFPLTGLSDALAMMECLPDKYNDLLDGP